MIDLRKLTKSNIILHLLAHGYMIMALLTLVIFSGCSNEKTYTFKQASNEINNIEIVKAESSLEFSVIKTLSETEQEDFQEQL